MPRRPRPLAVAVARAARRRPASGRPQRPRLGAAGRAPSGRQAGVTTLPDGSHRRHPDRRLWASGSSTAPWSPDLVHSQVRTAGAFRDRPVLDYSVQADPASWIVRERRSLGRSQEDTHPSVHRSRRIEDTGCRRDPLERSSAYRKVSCGRSRHAARERSEFNQPKGGYL